VIWRKRQIAKNGGNWNELRMNLGIFASLMKEMHQRKELVGIGINM
jgi:hypothetical protein